MDNEIKVLKLITGEEIITGLTRAQSGTLLLESPMSVKLAPLDSSGRIHLNLISWSLAGKTESIILEAKNVLVILEPTSVILSDYNSALSYEESAAETPTNVIKN